jgi:hypothetical protein
MTIEIQMMQTFWFEKRIIKRRLLQDQPWKAPQLLDEILRIHTSSFITNDRYWGMESQKTITT